MRGGGKFSTLRTTAHSINIQSFILHAWVPNKMVFVGLYVNFKNYWNIQY